MRQVTFPNGYEWQIIAECNTEIYIYIYKLREKQEMNLADAQE